MTSSVDIELIPILDALTIASPASFSFRDEQIVVQPDFAPALPGFPTHPLPSSPLVRGLQSLLYSRCYSHRFHNRQSEVPLPAPPDPDFLQQLSDNNRTHSRWEGGWTVYAVASSGQVSLIKGDRQRVALPGEFVTSGPPASAVQVGSIVIVQVLRDSTTAQPAFYFLYGDTLSDMWDEYALLRFYFNVPSAIAPALINYLTLQLNRYRIAFRMKALNNPALYTRTDAIVLYIAKRYYEICVRILQCIPEELANQLKADVPLFTLALAPGIGMAEEPNTGESFGMNRCRLVAEGITDAWMGSDQTSSGRLEAISKRFEQNGFNLQMPYLGPESVEFSAVLNTVEFAYA